MPKRNFVLNSTEDLVPELDLSKKDKFGKRIGFVDDNILESEELVLPHSILNNQTNDIRYNRQ